MPISQETLFFGHSLLTNKFPSKVKVNDYHKIAQAQQIDVQHFGLFETSSPDFNKYYPSVEPKDLEPSDDEYAFPLVRALSSIVINKFGPLDFTKKGVLKSALDLFQNQTVYVNHEDFTGNNVGVITEVSFENKRSYDGVEVPAGINARIRIDGKANPNLARAVMADPPEVHSVSVTVVFEWEQSHPKMDRSEFFDKMGSHDKDGNLIRRIVTKILLINELSFVSHGADPYAKIIQDGKISNPKDSSRRDEISQRKFSAAKFSDNMEHWYDYCDPLTSENFNDDTFILNTNINHKTKVNMNEELLKILRTSLGMDDSSDQAAVEVELQSRLPQLITDSEQLATSTQELTTLKEKYPKDTVILTSEDRTKLESYNENYGKHEKVYSTALQAVRDEAVKLYNVVTGNKVDEAILKLIAEGSYDTVVAMMNQYKTTAEEKFVASCQDCGSKKISRVSAASGSNGIINHEEGSEGSEGSEGGEHVELSTSETVSKIVKEQLDTGSAPSLFRKNNGK